MHHRLTIWRFAGERILEHPLLGWGMDASRHIGNHGEGVAVTLLNRTTGEHELVYEAMLPLHPHNGILQIWLELGAVGAVLFLASVLSVIGLIRAISQPFVRTAGCCAFAGALVIFCVSYGAWQIWWLAAMWLAAAAVAAAEAAAIPRPPG
jgi:O-antigen ligase